MSRRPRVHIGGEESPGKAPSGCGLWPRAGWQLGIPAVSSPEGLGFRPDGAAESLWSSGGDGCTY